MRKYLLSVLLLLALLTTTSNGQGINEAIADSVSDIANDVIETFEDIHDLAKDGLNQAKDVIGGITDAISERVDDMVDDVQEMLGLEKVENQVTSFVERTAFARRLLVRAAAGGAMVFYGLHFSHLVIFAHTLRTTSLPYLQHAWNETSKMYWNARETIKKEYPNLKHTRQLLNAVNFEMKATRKILKEAKAAAKDGKVTHAEAREAVRKANINLQELNKKSAVITQGLSSWSAVAAALDIKKIKELLKGVYTSVLACLATGSSSTLRGLSISFDLASLISRHLSILGHTIVERFHRFEVFKILPAEFQKVLALSVSLISLIKCLFVVHFVVPKMTLAISSSALGAAWLTDMLVDISDRQAGGVGKGLMRDKVLYLLSNLSLCLIGIAFQSSHASDEMPAWVEKMFWPAIKLENTLRSLDGVFSIGKSKLQSIFRKKHVKGTDGLSEAALTTPLAEASTKSSKAKWGRKI